MGRLEGWVQRQTDATARLEGAAFIVEEGSLGDLAKEERGPHESWRNGLSCSYPFSNQPRSLSLAGRRFKLKSQP